MMLARSLTETEMAALNQRRAFQQRIATRAAALAVPKKPPACIAKIVPEAVAAETDPPAPPLKTWFSIIGLVSNTLTINQVKHAVAAEFNLTIDFLISPRRLAQIVLARQVGMWLCKELMPEKSFPQIGRAFGRIDHTTVMHACRVLPVKIARSPDLAARVAKIRVDLKTAPPELVDG